MQVCMAYVSQRKTMRSRMMGGRMVNFSLRRRSERRFALNFELAGRSFSQHRPVK
jgi:hypothetical protein